MVSTISWVIQQTISGQIYSIGLDIMVYYFTWTKQQLSIKRLKFKTASRVFVSILCPIYLWKPFYRLITFLWFCRQDCFWSLYICFFLWVWVYRENCRRNIVSTYVEHRPNRWLRNLESTFPTFESLMAGHENRGEMYGKHVRGAQRCWPMLSLQCSLIKQALQSKD